jgi:hypothetical protein
VLMKNHRMAGESTAMDQITGWQKTFGTCLQSLNMLPQAKLRMRTETKLYMGHKAQGKVLFCCFCNMCMREYTILYTLISGTWSGFRSRISVHQLNSIWQQNLSLNIVTRFEFSLPRNANHTSAYLLELYSAVISELQLILASAQAVQNQISCLFNISSVNQQMLSVICQLTIIPSLCWYIKYSIVLLPLLKYNVWSTN